MVSPAPSLRQQWVMFGLQTSRRRLNSGNPEYYSVWTAVTTRFTLAASTRIGERPALQPPDRRE